MTDNEKYNAFIKKRMSLGLKHIMLMIKRKKF